MLLSYMASLADLFLNGEEFFADVLEAFDDFEVLLRFRLFFFEFLLGALEGHAPLFDEVVDEVEVVDVRFGELAVAFFVLVGFDDVEFFFPKADEGGVYPEHVGDFADGVIYFERGVLLCHGGNPLFVRCCWLLRRCVRILLRRCR